jgi:hypothetical protein
MKIGVQNAYQRANKRAAERCARRPSALGIFADLNALEVTPTSQIGAREILSCVPVRQLRQRRDQYRRQQERLSEGF